MNPIEARMHLDARRRRQPTLKELVAPRQPYAGVSTQLRAQRRLELLRRGNR